MRTLGTMVLMLALGACERDALFVDLTEDMDGDGFPVATDCNDGDETVFPGAQEVCNGVDDDCDGFTDGDSATDATTWYLDLDGDGEAGTASPLRACEAPVGAVPEPTDCDDSNVNIFPGAPEVCNDRDDDCDGLVDTTDPDLVDGSSRVFYEDADGDGHASSASVGVESCSTPTGFVLAIDDCDDTDANVFPGAIERCNGIDDDCNTLVDDDDPRLDLASTNTFYTDRDADGFGGLFYPVRACEQPVGTTVDATDCDDVDARIFPGATEVCDGRDNDCNGTFDDEDDAVDLTTGTAWYVDADNDGFGAGSPTLACDAPAGMVAVNTDCVDTDPAISPSAAEICNDIDDDCDSRIDDVDPSLDANSATRWWADRDNDGVGGTFFSIVSCQQPNGMVEASGDCEDDNADVSPLATEVCNGVDDNCNILIDDEDGELDLASATEWFADADGDGWGSGADSTFACIAPTGFGVDQSDCDDADSSISPSASEVCNGIDDNCDDLVDDMDPNLDASAGAFFVDNDRDGFGTNDEVACMDFGAGWSDILGDCDDANDGVNPGADERCNSVDDNCNDEVDEDPIDGEAYFVDADRDGYGTDEMAIACRADSGLSEQTGDCDDTRDDVRPGATERCDGIDNNCNGIVDVDTPDLPEWYEDQDGDGFGRDDSGIAACLTFDDRVGIAGDCDDSDPLVGPGNEEVDDDLVDNDCDGGVDFPAPLVGGLIDEDITWGDGTPGVFDLDVNALVTSDTTLTILPCTRVRLAATGTLQIEGTLIARGTEDCPIVITSSAETPSPGDWSRVFFTPSSTGGVMNDQREYVSGSILEHVVVEYAGGAEGGETAVSIDAATAPYIRNLTVRHSSGGGLGASVWESLLVRDSQFSDNARFGAGLDGRTVDAENLSFSNNGAAVGAVDGLRVVGCTFSGPASVLNVADTGRQPGMISDNVFVGGGLTHEFGNLTYTRNVIVGGSDGLQVRPGFERNVVDVHNNVLVDIQGDAVALAQGSGSRVTLDFDGNQFVRTGTGLGFGDQTTVTELTVTNNLFAHLTSDQAWVTFPAVQHATVRSSLQDNTFIGTAAGGYFHVGYLAGSGLVPAQNNFWSGADPTVSAAPVIDFFDFDDFAVADVSPVLFTPQEATPISPPTNVRASIDEGTVSLTWDANPQSDVVGYRVHYGQQTQAWLFDASAALQGASGFTVSGETATLSGLDLTLPWRVAITAIDRDADGTDDLFEGHESWFSNIVVP